MASSIGRCLRAVAARSSSTGAVLGRHISITRSPAAHRVASQQTYYRQFSATSLCRIRKYTKDHEWIDLKADGKSGTLGISEYAADQLGDVVYVELPKEGSEFKLGDPIGAVESVKSAADINAPVSCTVKSVNILLEEKPGTINKVPEDDSTGGGWIAKVILDQEGVDQMQDLMDQGQYNAFIHVDGED